MIPSTKFLAIDQYIIPLNLTFEKYQINTKERMSAFLAQVLHESANLTRVIENLSYSAEGLIKTWPTRFNAQNAPEYARNQEKIANKVYSNRLGNGDEASGEGFKYRGRGLIQVTGKTNYEACGKALGIDLVNDPRLLETPMYATLSAGWFWNDRKLNDLADIGTQDAFHAISKKINGGTLGKKERIELFERIKNVL